MSLQSCEKMPSDQGLVFGVVEDLKFAGRDWQYDSEAMTFH